MSDLLTVQDLEAAKKHDTFHSEVITGKQGGVFTGADIDYATNQVTGQTQKTLPAIMRDLGFEPASFDFTTGGALAVDDRSKAVLWPLTSGGDGDWYYWEGALPKIIPAASTPASTGGVAAGGWRPVGDIALREALATAGNANLVDDSNIKVQATSPGSVSRTQHSKNNDTVSVKDYGAIGDGTTDDTAAVAAAIAAGVKHFPAGVYLVTTTTAFVQGSTGLGKIKYSGVEYPAGDFINVGKVLPVPSVFPTIQGALDWLEGKRLLGDSSYATIQVADGTYTITSAIESRVLDGKKLSIRGNETTPANVVLNVNNANNADGFLFRRNFGCGWLNGFTINGTYGWTSHGVWKSEVYGSGVRAVDGAVVTMGPQMRINKMYYGVRAMYGAAISCNGSQTTSGVQGGGVIVNESGDCGFHAYAATIRCNYAESYYSAHTSEGLGFGFCAEANGFILNEYSKAAHNGVAGFYTLSRGSMWAHGVVGNGNVYGAYTIGGTLEINSLGAYQTNLYSNTGAGAHATQGGFIGGNSAWCNQNANGVIASYGGVVDITAMKANSNTYAGYLSQYGSVIRGSGATANTNATGFRAEANSTMHIPSAGANNNTSYGYYATLSSIIHCIGFGGTGNATFCSPIQISVTDAAGNRGSYMANVAI